jgi:arylsulfatase A-like enzyme
MIRGPMRGVGPITRPWIPAIAALIAAAAATAQPTAEPAPPVDETPRAIVLITIDSLRADAVSSPSRARASTPFLESLGAEGVVFERAYAPSSWTAPSMASLFSGVYPSSHGVETGALSGGGREIVGQPSLSDQFTTLAERLRDAWYTTIGVPSNRHLSKRLGFAQGFDHYDDEAPFRPAPAANLRVRELLREAYGPQWRKEWKNRKTFLWIHYFDPHVPYQAREPWIHEFAPGFAEQPELFPAGLDESEIKQALGKINRRAGARLWPLYLSEIRFLDERLERLAEDLDLRDPDVALVVTSDHGEELADHGGLGHGRTLYEEVVRVPLVVRWPQSIEGGRRSRTAVSLVDIYPTLIDLADGDRPFGLQGSSLARLLRGGPADEERSIVLQLQPRAWADGGVVALTDGRWKLVRPKRKNRRARLFDLWSDPRESRNVARDHEELVRELQEELDLRLSSFPAPPDRPQPRIDSEERKADLASSADADGR